MQGFFTVCIFNELYADHFCLLCQWPFLVSDFRQASKPLSSINAKKNCDLIGGKQLATSSGRHLPLAYLPLVFVSGYLSFSISWWNHHQAETLKWTAILDTCEEKYTGGCLAAEWNGELTQACLCVHTQKMTGCRKDISSGVRETQIWLWFDVWGFF